ncbi:MAG: TonB family protein [Paludibacteraceae bacterium]|nr:TonB family protein [Paludibacteraceae bacterium]
MPKGKKTCEFLRTVRQQVADANGIAYTPAVCTHKGECAGTCPVCERERQYIEMQLASKAKKGKALKIVGIAAGLSTMVACQEAKGQESLAEDSLIQQKFQWEYNDFTMGVVGPPPANMIQVEEMAEFISKFPNDTFLIVGHTDGIGVGSFDYNLKLSEHGAKHLRNFLAGKGADSTRIKTIGCGWEEPATLNPQNVTKQLQNTRVTLEFYTPERVKEIEDKIAGKPSEKIWNSSKVDEAPQFPGGKEALMTFIKKNLRYPFSGDVCFQGKVYVSFVVEKDGSITNVEVERGIDPAVDKEAVRLVKSMPKWKPGIQKGEAVRCRSFLPISFNYR